MTRRRCTPPPVRTCLRNRRRHRFPQPRPTRRPPRRRPYDASPVSAEQGGPATTLPVPRPLRDNNQNHGSSPAAESPGRSAAAANDSFEETVGKRGKKASKASEAAAGGGRRRSARVRAPRLAGRGWVEQLDQRRRVGGRWRAWWLGTDPWAPSRLPRAPRARATARERPL